VISRTGVTDILLAVPSASRARRTEIMHALRHLDLHVRTLPGLLDMARGSVSVSDLRDVEIEDLLGRPPVPPNEDLLQKNIREKVVLVTGAGGSIGS
jgi:FlaA1/EpsC-like NDP-sugar epimerase